MNKLTTNYTIIEHNYFILNELWLTILKIAKSPTKAHTMWLRNILLLMSNTTIISHTMSTITSLGSKVNTILNNYCTILVQLETISIIQNKDTWYLD